MKKNNENEIESNENMERIDPQSEKIINSFKQLNINSKINFRYNNKLRNEDNVEQLMKQYKVSETEAIHIETDMIECLKKSENYYEITTKIVGKPLGKSKMKSQENIGKSMNNYFPTQINNQTTV